MKLQNISYNRYNMFIKDVDRGTDSFANHCISICIMYLFYLYYHARIK